MNRSEKEKGSPQNVQRKTRTQTQAENLEGFTPSEQEEERKAARAIQNIPPYQEPKAEAKKQEMEENLRTNPPLKKKGKRQWEKETKEYCQRQGHQWKYELGANSTSEEEDEKQPINKKQRSPPPPTPPTSHITTHNAPQQPQFPPYNAETFEDNARRAAEAREFGDPRLDPNSPNFDPYINPHSSSYERPYIRKVPPRPETPIMENQMVLFDDKHVITTTSDGLDRESESANQWELEAYDREYRESAPPITYQFPDNTDMELYDNDSSSCKTQIEVRSNQKLNGYAKQTEGDDQWDWDGIAIEWRPRMGKCVVATQDLYPGYRFPYGGIYATIHEVNNYRRQPRLPPGQLNEYLTICHRPHPRKKGKFIRTYLDGHPRHIEEERAKRYCWPGVYCNQANYLKNINAELAELGPRHRPPRYHFVLPDSKMFIIVTKKISKGELVQIDYRMSKQTQMKRKFGPIYKAYAEKKSRSHQSKAYGGGKASHEKKQSISSQKVSTISKTEETTTTILPNSSEDEDDTNNPTSSTSALRHQTLIFQTAQPHPEPETTNLSEQRTPMQRWLDEEDFEMIDHRIRRLMRQQYDSLYEDLHEVERLKEKEEQEKMEKEDTSNRTIEKRRKRKETEEKRKRKNKSFKKN